jgi:hypothetical protein
MKKDHSAFLRNSSPEEVAQNEGELIKDVPRIARLPLVRAIREHIVESQDDELLEAYDSLLQILAIWKRTEVRQKVLLKRAIRKLVQTGVDPDELRKTLNLNII